ncbi:hypothetical protein MIDIC_240036 [Alphaproteobacteria bacterium]
MSLRLIFYGDGVRLKANYLHKQEVGDLVELLSNERKRLYCSVDGVDKDFRRRNF